MSTRALSDLVPEMQYAFGKIKERFDFDNHDFFLKLICAYRSPEEQYEIWQQGRDKNGNIVNRKEVLTFCDGRTTKSKHNLLPAQAFDVGIFQVVRLKTGKRGEKYLPASPLYETLGEYAYGLPIRWGGNFKSFKDWPHFETL